MHFTTEKQGEWEGKISVFFIFLFKKRHKEKVLIECESFFHWKYSCNSQYEESEIKMIIMKLLCKHITTRFDGRAREKWNDCYKTLMSSPLCFMCYAFLPSTLLEKWNYHFTHYFYHTRFSFFADIRMFFSELLWNDLLLAKIFMFINGLASIFSYSLWIIYTGTEYSHV